MKVGTRPCSDEVLPRSNRVISNYWFASGTPTFLVYQIDRGTPYKPVLEWTKRLTSPLRIRLEEEVDERVSRVPCGEYTASH